MVQIQERLVDRSDLGREMLYDSQFIRNHYVFLSHSGRHFISGAILIQRIWATTIKVHANEASRRRIYGLVFADPALYEYIKPELLFISSSNDILNISGS